MNASKTAALVAVVAIILVGAFYVGTQEGIVTGPPSSSGSTSSTSSLTSTTSMTTSGGAGSASGLQLQLAVNASSNAASNSVTFQIRATEYNTLAAMNNVSASRQWALSGVSLGTCGTEVYPFGMAIYSGTYTSANASAATPLRIYPVVACPLLIRLVTGYLFEPTSDMAIILPSGSGSTPTLMSANVTANAEYSGTFGSSSSSTPLPPGTYTVAAADEWGSVVFLHFAIGSGTTTHSTGTGTNLSGTLTAAFDVGPIQPVCSANTTTRAAPSQYASYNAVVTDSSGDASTFPIAWVSNGCDVLGTFQAPLVPGNYSLNLSSCPWMGCSSTLPKSFSMVAGQSTNLSVSIDTGIR